MEKVSKREFLRLSGTALAGAVLAPTFTFCSNPSNGEGAAAAGAAAEGEIPTFEAIKLPYSYDALVPNIDAQTMEVHYSKHYAGYTRKLNAALEGKTAFSGNTIEEILSKVTKEEGHTDIRNNGGGYYNHTLFWKIMSPNGGGSPTGDVAAAIDGKFGSYDTFKQEFSKAAGSVFGSGWAWLIVDGNKEIQITTTPNQDSPLMTNIADKTGNPILGIDVWEHAYYLKYQNERGKYIDNFFNVINWDEVNQNMKKA